MEFHHISPTRGVVDYTTGKELHLSSWINLKGTKIFNILFGRKPKFSGHALEETYDEWPPLVGGQMDYSP